MQNDIGVQYEHLRRRFGHRAGLLAAAEAPVVKNYTVHYPPNSAIDVGAVDTRREIRERIFIRQVSHNEADAVHTTTRQGGMIWAFYVHLSR